MIPYGKDHNTKLKGVTVDPGARSSPTTSPTGKGQKQQAPCKFWSTDEGCRRGSNCKYTRNFASKEDKKARCWTCDPEQPLAHNVYPSDGLHFSNLYA